MNGKWTWNCSQHGKDVPCSASLDRCGDNNPDSPQEQCDDGGLSETCDAMCQNIIKKPVCGDENIDKPNVDGFHEECDDGPTGSDTCTEQCTIKKTVTLCGSQQGPIYTTSRGAWDRSGACPAGATIENFSYGANLRTWNCQGNGQTISAGCSAIEIFCGNGEHEPHYGEECDG